MPGNTTPQKLQPQRGLTPQPQDRALCTTTEAGAKAGSIPQADRARMKGTAPLLEGKLAWGGARGREGQHISSHLTRVISTAIEVSTHRVLKAEASPRGILGKVKVNQDCQAGWGQGAGMERSRLRKQPVQMQWGTGCPELTDTECLSVTLGAAKGL